MKRIFVDMSVSLLHHGHIRLLEKAKSLGYVIVALTTDDEIEKHKGFKPELSFDQRREILLSIKYVDEVIASPWKLDDQFLALHKVDLLVHSGDNFNQVSPVISFERTAGVSSAELRRRGIASIIEKNNSERILLTPGPGNLHPENILDIRPVFTRGDEEYDAVEKRVLGRIAGLAGQDSIVALQGSATTAIAVATTNFLYGKVAVILSGFYSRRLHEMLDRTKTSLNLSYLQALPYEGVIGKEVDLSGFDWIVAAYTETADAFLIDLREIKRLSTTGGAHLMLDATGSINLEDDHELADVCMFSSCKGLGGLTGAAFITFNKVLLDRLNPSPKDFVLDLTTHLEKKTTGPAHAICSLNTISSKFDQMRQRVRTSKEIFMDRFSKYIPGKNNQPALCTKVTGVSFRLPQWVLPYRPRVAAPGTEVVCHLFDQFPSNRAPGESYSLFEPV